MDDTKKNKKILWVIHRYGEDIVGGAELHARWIVEHLKEQGYDIEVATTCAKDYVTWKNEYKEGEEIINNVMVRRFKVDRERNQKKNYKAEVAAFFNPEDIKAGEKWESEQGPYSTSLLNFLKKNKDTYSRFIYSTYLYATTFYGIQITPKEKNVLIPLAHKELSLYTRVVERVFDSASYIVYNTLEEKKLLYNRLPRLREIPSSIVGVGINQPENLQELIKHKESDVDYLIYAGRIDEAKNCPELFEYFLKYIKHNSDLNLYLIGKEIIPIPKSDNIKYFGFVSEEEKFKLMSKAKALIVPSLKESLSMILLESLICKTPVIVNEGCDVLKAHIVKGNCGLWYSKYSEFEADIDYLIQHPKISKIMAENGNFYVNNNYTWEIVLKEYGQFI